MNKKKLLFLTLCMTTHMHAKDVWILVHGTFANKVSKVVKSAGWWNPGQPFYNALKQQVPKNTKIHAFTWNGSNFHDKRIQAGRDFAAFIPTVASKGDTIHIVAHSHGANVASEGLKHLATVQSPFKIKHFFALGAPISTAYLPAETHVAKVFNLFSYGDFVQPVLNTFSRVLPEQENTYNVQVKINNSCPSHIGMHDPLIARHLPDMDTLLPNNKPHCVSFFSDKDPVATLDVEREKDLQIDKYFTTQLITGFAESKKRGHTQAAKISQKTKDRLVRLWNRWRFDPQSITVDKR